MQSAAAALGEEIRHMWAFPNLAIFLGGPHIKEFQNRGVYMGPVPHRKEHLHTTTPPKPEPTKSQPPINRRSPGPESPKIVPKVHVSRNENLGPEINVWEPFFGPNYIL